MLASDVLEILPAIIHHTQHYLPRTGIPGPHHPLLRASEALILSRLMMDGSNSIVIRFENTLISASITPRVFRSFSSKNDGRSPSFVLERSRIPLARLPVGTAAAIAPFFTVPDCTIIFATDCFQVVDCS